MVTVNPGNPVLEGTNGSVQFTFTNAGAASRIGGAGTAVFPQMGDAFDFANFGALNFGNCDPFANNVLGACTMTQPFTTDMLIPNEFVDTGTRKIRGGILLANGQMAFGQAQVVVADPPVPPPPPVAALMIQPDFASVAEGGSGTLHFLVTNTGAGNAVIAQVTPDTLFLFGNNTDDAGILRATGCDPGTILAPAASCTVAIPFFTPFTAAPSEDSDFGVTSVGLNIVLTTGNSSDGIGGVLVSDVPEPSTALLFCIGMMGIICWRRRAAAVSSEP